MNKYFATIISLLVLVSAPVVLAVDALDTDNDGLLDSDELTVYHTDPNYPDTDGDGYPDGSEIINGYSPLLKERKKMTDIDTDKDGLNDALEIQLRTNLTNKDTDGDEFTDGAEVANGFNPLKGDRDRSLKRHVEVDLNTQQMAWFLGGVKIGSMAVSTGKLSTPTPVGEFAVMRKVPVVHYIGPGYDLPNTKWNLEFKKSFYLHGAYWHNQFGIRPMSHGCVNIAYKDVEKLYNFMDVGDKVKITGKTPAKVQISAVKK